jgi:hypothetical protein
LQDAYNEAKNTVIQQRGEISIVRNKHDRSTREYERRLNVMRQLHAEEVSKQKIELEKTRKEKETAETSSRFLEHDLAQEIGRARQNRRPLPLRNTAETKPRTARTSPAVTPKKQVQQQFRDGFDDEDIMMLSPSKPKDRSKPSTPRAGPKRKRSTVDHSPSISFTLPLDESRNVLKPQESMDTGASDTVLEAVNRFGFKDDRFQFLWRALNRHPADSDDRFFDALARFKPTWGEGKHLGSLLMDAVDAIPASVDSKDFIQKFFHAVADLWCRCEAHEYFEPVPILVDFFQFMLAHEPSSTVGNIAERLIPAIMATVDKTAIPIAKANNPIYAKELESPRYASIRKHVNNWDCLSLLHDVALNCQFSEKNLVAFWKCMQHDFMLVMLMKAQPLEENILALRILATSSLEASFGAILSYHNPEQQVKQETALLDRLSTMLLEQTDPHSDRSSASPLDVADLRIEVLNVLSTFALSPYGGEALARHRFSIGRLIRFLDLQIDSLYAYNLPTHMQTSHLVNKTMRLIHHLALMYPNIVDLRQKIMTVPGGNHKFLVALTRLAFSENMVMEAGIEEEVIEIAHGLLDEFLSPEEGEALLKVFSTGKSAG